eukprot:UC1_evm4s1820
MASTSVRTTPAPTPTPPPSPPPPTPKSSHPSEDMPVWRTVKPFVNGGTAATLGIIVMNPVDVLKTRLQVQGGGSVAALAKQMASEEGPRAFYKGLSAQFLRAWTYQTARLGAYRSLTQRLQPADGSPLPLAKKAACGLTAGAFGAVIGTPAELAIIRLQTDSTLPLDQRRNYRHALHALWRTAAEEGVAGMWKGCGPTVVRAMALNCGSLAAYDQTKETIMRQFGAESSDGGARMGIVGASFVSGLVGAVFSLPFDFVKTQIQRMKPDPQGRMPFKGPIDCARKTLAEHGPLRFYAGLPTYSMRIAPMITLTWFIIEGLRSAEADIGL